MLLKGQQNLNVVGEFFYQAQLWRLTGRKRPPGDYVHQDVHQDVHAVLVAEDDNPHDANAVAVWIDGVAVGHLSREDARQLRPGLLALQQKHGEPIVLEGVISGARPRHDNDAGMLAVFLGYNPQDFGRR